MRRLFATVLAILFGLTATPAADQKVLFANDFEKVVPGELPADSIVLAGQFDVKEDAGNRFLELPGAPLDSFGFMFGPAGKENWSAQARIFATAAGRRFPVFGVSINGYNGYRAQVAPAKRALELLEGDEVRASVPFQWQSGSWTIIRVQLRKTSETAWKVEGKAWIEGTAEPSAWQVAWDETDPPLQGRSIVWGYPFSGTPIRFDDLKVLPAPK